MRKIFILIDGLSSTYLKYMPNLKKIMQIENAIVSKNVMPQKCTITQPNMFSILTGLTINQHKLEKNSTEYTKQQIQFFNNEISKTFPNGFTFISDTKGLDNFIKMVTYLNFKNLKKIKIKNLEQALVYSLQNKGDFIIYLECLDKSGHQYGWLSEYSIEVAKNIDEKLNFLFLHYKKFKNTTFIIAGDHGGINFHHSPRQCKDRKTFDYDFDHKNLRTIICCFSTYEILNFVLPSQPKTHTFLKKYKLYKNNDKI